MKMINTLLLALFTLCFVSYLGGYGIRVNRSPSLKNKVYLSFPASEPKLGQIVTFSHPKSKVTFAKVVAGKPGDVVQIEKGKVFINGDEKGCVLESFAPINNGVIPNEFYFLMGTHPDSFDSRYEEFGLISKKLIKERLWAIF